MKSRYSIAGAIALGLALCPVTALADDPRDPDMQSREARERDAAMIRQLNREQLAYVRERDARWAEQRREQEARLAQYEREMAEWRHAVKMCRAGDTRYCAR